MRQAGVLVLALALLSACAHRPTDVAPSVAHESGYSGRLSVRIEGPSPQAWSAFFDFKGTAQSGQLTLSGPLGGTVGIVSWSAGSATLKLGEQTLLFGSVEALTEHYTGAALPLPAIIDWLAGRQAVVPGWQVDPTEQSLEADTPARLTARRHSPLPTVQLTLTLLP